MAILYMIIVAIIAVCVVAEVKAIQKACKVNKAMKSYQVMVLNTNCSDADLQRKAAEIRQML